MTAVAALGDSLTCGEGVGVRVAAERTWAAQLAACLPDGRLTSHARPGARVADVLAEQLPRVAEADVATLVVGLNDVARAGFDGPVVRRDLHEAVGALSERARTVLVGRLHDPCSVMWLPAPLRRLVRARVAEVNAAVDEVAGRHAVRVLDLRTVGPLRDRAGWAVDRVHPNDSGHVALAVEAARVLRDAGWPVEQVVAAGAPRAVSRAARAWWCATRGAPYLLTHAGEFGRPALSALRRPPAAPATPQ